MSSKSPSEKVKVQSEVVPSMKPEPEQVTSQTHVVTQIQPEHLTSQTFVVPEQVVISQTPVSNDQVTLQPYGWPQQMKDTHLPDASDQQRSSECKQAASVLARVQAVKSKEKAKASKCTIS